MSVIREIKVKALNNIKVMVEEFSSANEVVEVSKQRPITSTSFHDYEKEGVDKSWTGVSSLEEARELLRTGYQPTVDKLNKTMKANVSGNSKRVSFHNDVVGYAPVVPLFLQGVPNSMQNSYMKPIKAKVLNVYYDMTASCSTTKEDIINAGQKLLGAILALEMQGYRFNLYAIQSYCGGGSADMMCIKIKNSNTPIDLKKMSFPLTHTAFFRVIGFDWYARTPKGIYRSAYGHALGYDFNEKKMSEGFSQIFGQPCVVFTCAKIIKEDSKHIENILKGSDK